MIVHKSKIEIIKLLVKEVNLKGPVNIWGREIKLLNQLIEKYPEETFWRGLNFGFQLNSLAWFKIDGKAELEKAWRYYKLTGPQNNSLDSNIKSSIIENERIEQGSALF